MSSCLDFICIDVETANCDRESICQIGLVTVKNSSIVDTWEILVNPEDWFDPWNIDWSYPASVEYLGLVFQACDRCSLPYRFITAHAS